MREQSKISLIEFFRSRSTPTDTTQAISEREISRQLAKIAVAEGLEYAQRIVSSDGPLMPRQAPDIRHLDISDCQLTKGQQ